MSTRFQDFKEQLGTRVEAPLMDYLTGVGEQHGIDSLIYNPLRMRMFHRYAVRDASAVMGAIEQLFPEARRYIDVGAGSGAFAADARRRGREVLAYERSRVGRWLARRQGVECRSFDLNSNLEQLSSVHGDLAYSFEVAEHLPPPLGERLVRLLTLLAPRVVFTAAQPGQGGAGHVNEQPREYWRERFAVHNFEESGALSNRLSRAFSQRGVHGTWFVHNVAVYQAGR